jgi:hypothetical protein
MMMRPSWWHLELSGDIQYAGFPLDQSGLGSSHATTKHNRHYNHHNHGRRRWKWLPSAAHEALHSTLTCQMDGWQPPRQAGIILGCVEVVYGPQIAPLFQQCTSPQHWSVLRAIHTLNTPQNYIRLLGRLSSIHLMRWREAQDLMWGARGGHLCRRWPWSDMVVLAVVG